MTDRSQLSQQLADDLFPPPAPAAPQDLNSSLANDLFPDTAFTNPPELPGQMVKEMAITQNAREKAIKADAPTLLGAGGEHALQSQDTVIRDNPAIPYDPNDPASRQSAFLETGKRHLEQGLNIMPGHMIKQTLDMADWQTAKLFSELKLDQIPGMENETREVRGAMLSNLQRLYAGASGDEIRLLNKNAMGRVGATLLKAIDERIALFPTQSGTIDFKASGTDIVRANNEELTGLEADRIVLEGLLENTDSALTQDYFLSAMGQAIQAQKEFTDLDSPEHDELELLENLLAIPVQASQQRLYDMGPRGFAPVTRHWSELFQKYGWLRDERGAIQPMSAEKILTLSYQGELTRSRLRAMGVSNDAIESADLSFEGLIHFTHPDLANRLADRRAQHMQLTGIEEQGPAEARIPETLDDIERDLEQNLRNGVGPDMADLMLRRQLGPLRELATNISIRAPNIAESAMLGVGGMLMSLMGDVQRGAATVAEGLAFLPTLNVPLPDVLGQEEAPSKRIEPLISFTASGTVLHNEQLVERALREGMENFDAIVHPSTIKDAPRWARDLSDLYFLETGPDGKMRQRLTDQGVRKLLPTRNFLKTSAMLVWEDNIVANAQRFAPFEFQAETLRQLLEPTRRKLNDESIGRSMLKGFTQKEADQQASAMLNSWRNFSKTGNLVQLWQDGLASMVIFTGREMRTALEFIMNDPDKFVAAEFLGAGFGAVAAPVIGAAATPAMNRLNATLVGKQFRFAVEEATSRSPNFIRNVQELTEKTAQGMHPAAALKHMEAISNTASYIKRQRDDFMGTDIDMPNRRQMHEQLRENTAQAGREIGVEAEKIARKVTPETMGEILDDLKFDSMAKHYITKPQLFRQLVREVGRKMGFRVGGKRLNPSFAGDSAPLFNKILDNPDIDLKRIPVIPELLDDEMTEFWQRAMQGSTAELGVGDSLNTAVRWFSRYKTDVLRIRDMNAEKWANLDEWIAQKRVTHANETERRGVTAAVARDSGNLEVTRDIEGIQRERLADLSALDIIQKEIRGRQFDRKLEGMADSPAFLNDTAEDLMTHLVGRSGYRQFYQRMRRPFEFESEFSARVQSLQRRHNDKDPDQVRAEIEHDEFRREIFAEYMEAPGIRERVDFDVLSGQAVTKARRALLRAERRGTLENPLDEKISAFVRVNPELADDVRRLQEVRDEARRAAAGDGDVFEEAYGLRGREDLKDFWVEMKRLAVNETANLAVRGGRGNVKWGNFWQVAQEIGDGNVGRAVSAAKDMALSMKLNKRAHVERLDRIQRGFDRLGKDEKQLLNIALIIERDEGFSASLRLLRDDPRFKDYFQHAAPRTADDAVAGVLDDLRGFRDEFLRDMQKAGVVDKATYDFLAGPYATRLFMDYEFPRLIGDQWQVSIKGIPLTRGAMEAQRHIRKYKVLVYGKNTGAPITEVFDDLGGAQRWLTEKFGVGKMQAMDTNRGIQGKTAVGNEAFILEPLGEAVTKELGEIAPGAGLFIRMRGLIDDVTTKQYLDAFDRRGIALTDDEFQTFMKSKLGRNMGPGWTHLPETGFGNLSGKWVPREIAFQIDDFSEALVSRRAVWDALDIEIRVMGAAGKAWLHGKRALSTLNDLAKTGIATFGIAMNPAVMIGNFLSDLTLFRPAASSNKSFLTMQGWRNTARAASVIRKLRKGARINELGEGAEEWMALGVVDDGFFSRVGTKTRDIDAIFGKLDPGRAALAPLADIKLRGLLRQEEKLRAGIQAARTNSKKRARMALELAEVEDKIRAKLPEMTKAWAREGNIMRRPLSAPLQRIRVAASEIRKISGDFYNDLGNINRLGAYFDLLEDGFDPATAAKRVNTFMQTYSRVPKPVRRAGRHFLGSPIISFPYELGRIGMNIMAQRPGFYSAWMLGAIGRNVTSLAATGVNPYMWMQEMKGNSPLGANVLTMMSNHYTGDLDGNIMGMSMPALALPEMIWTQFGAVQGLTAAWDDPNADGIGKAINFLTRLTTNVAFTGPIFNAAVSMVTAKDPVTGDTNLSGLSLLGGNAQNFLQLMMPRWTPFFGANHNSIQRAVSSPSGGYSRRRTSVAQKILQTFTGLRFRGDISTLIPEAAEPLAGKFAKGIAWMLAVETPDSLEVLVGQNRNIDYMDVFDGLRHMTARSDNGPDLSQEVGDDFRAFRRILEWEANGTPEQKEEAEKLKKETLLKLGEKYEVDNLLNDPAFTRTASTRDLLNILRRASKFSDPMTMLDNMSLFRRTQVVATMAKLGAPREIMDNLINAYIFTSSGSMGTITDPGELQDSLRGVQALIANPLPFSDMDSLKMMEAWLEVSIPDAEEADTNNILRDEKNIQGFFELERMGLIK